MTWDTSTPLGSESILNGDNRIRELKTDLATALTTEGSFPGADTANPKFRWTPPRGNTAARPSSPVTGQLYINTETLALERYSGTVWESIDFAGNVGSSIAGSGLALSSNVLSVNVDSSTIEVNADTLRVKDAGITEAKLNASVAGSGLAGGAGTALSVNVDNSTVEVNSDTVRVKDSGITASKIYLSGCRLDWTYAGTSVDPGATSTAYTFNPVVVSAGFDRGMTVASNAFTVPTTGLYVYGGRISFNCDDTHGSNPLTVRINGSRDITLGSSSAALNAYYYFGGTVHLIAAETYHMEVDTDCDGGAHNPNFYKIRGELYIQYHA